jgi:alpha/beta superfamily hydrolase
MSMAHVPNHYPFKRRILRELKQENINSSYRGHSLTGVLKRPVPDSTKGVILLHPHPLYGGDKDNHIVKELEHTFLKFGFVTFRFDFRGVSSRPQEYAGIAGAVEDTYKAMELMEIYELKSLGLVGYSFGGSTALRTASSRSVHFVVTLSASYDLFREGNYDESYLTRIRCPVLMFHGQSDTMVSHSDLSIFSSKITTIKAVSLENEDHFYERSFPRVVDEIHTFVFNLFGKDAG